MMKVPVAVRVKKGPQVIRAFALHEAPSEEMTVEELSSELLSGKNDCGDGFISPSLSSNDRVVYSYMVRRREKTKNILLLLLICFFFIIRFLSIIFAIIILMYLKINKN